MSEAGSASATPPDPDWTWWSGLTNAEPQRQPQRPTLILTGDAIGFERLEDLAAVLAERLAGRAPILKRSVASWPDFDTFPAFSVYAQGQGAQATAAAVYLGCVAVQKTKAAELEAAIAAAGAAQARDAA